MSSKDQAGIVEKRAHPRILATRKVYIVSGRRAWKCSLIDIAIGGARISVEGVDFSLGDLFLVDSRTHQIHLTHAVWRSDAEAGLQFIKTEKFTGPAGGVEGALDIATRFSIRLKTAKPLVSV
jgi:hypothetical protein